MTFFLLGHSFVHFIFPLLCESVVLDGLKSIGDFEDVAKIVLPSESWTYFRTGSEKQITYDDNLAAYDRYAIHPRMLRDVSKRSMVTSVLGKPVSSPLGAAPTASHNKADPVHAEIATAKACQEAGIIYIRSQLSSKSIEEIAKAVPGGRKWQQIYVHRNRNVTANIIARAALAGFEAIVLTVDSPTVGNWHNNDHEDFESRGCEVSGRSMMSRTEKDLELNDGVTWSVIRWVKSITSLPIVLKGILTKDDALLAAEHGVDGIIVSNHGGRQLDSVPATMDVIEHVSKAVRDRLEVYMDGGIRHGTDIFKAIAKGAKMVFVGRPILYGLSLGGKSGVDKVIRLLQEEFNRTMALAGVSTVNDIDETYVKKRK